MTQRSTIHGQQNSYYLWFNLRLFIPLLEYAQKFIIHKFLPYITYQKKITRNYFDICLLSKLHQREQARRRTNKITFEIERMPLAENLQSDSSSKLRSKNKFFSSKYHHIHHIVVIYIRNFCIINFGWKTWELYINVGIRIVAFCFSRQKLYSCLYFCSNITLLVSFSRQSPKLCAEIAILITDQAQKQGILLKKRNELFF